MERLKWAKTPPDKDGFYWHKSTEFGEISVAQVKGDWVIYMGSEDAESKEYCSQYFWPVPIALPGDVS